MARKKKGFSTYTIDNGQESTTQAKANLKLGMMKGGSGIVEVHLKDQRRLRDCHN